MYRSHSIGVIVPAYNEESFVGDVIREMPDLVDRIYVVDDCSQDETATAALSAARTPESDGEQPQQPSFVDSFTDVSDALSDRVGEYHETDRLVVLRHDVNRGAGGAIKTGYLASLEDETDIIATIDADGQMDPDLLPRFLDPIVDDEADYTKGDRLSNPSYRTEMPRFRLVGNTMLTYLTRVASGYWEVTDPQNGYTAVSKQMLERLNVEHFYEYYGYLNDLLIRLNVEGAAIRDVPLPAVYRDEESHIDYPTYIRKVSLMLSRDFAWRLRTRYSVADLHPVAVLYSLGTLLFLLGTLQFLRSPSSESDGPLSFVATYTVGAGCLVSVLILDSVINKLYGVDRGRTRE